MIQSGEEAAVGFLMVVPLCSGDQLDRQLWDTSRSRAICSSSNSGWSSCHSRAFPSKFCEDGIKDPTVGPSGCAVWKHDWYSSCHSVCWSILAWAVFQSASLPHSLACCTRDFSVCYLCQQMCVACAPQPTGER